MKNIYKITTAIALCFLSLGTTYGRTYTDNNWYLSGSGSLSMQNDLKFKDNDGDTLGMKHKPGINTNIAVGQIMNNWRVELESGYRYNKIDKLSINNQSISLSELGMKGDTNDITLMANVFYDIPLTDHLSWYVGGGAGIAFTEVNFKAQGITSSGYKTSPAVQGMTGLTYELSENWDIFCGYRYFVKTSKTESRLSDGSILKSNTPMSHNIDLGLRFKF